MYDEGGALALDEGGWADEPAEDDCEKLEITEEDIALFD